MNSIDKFSPYRRLTLRPLDQVQGTVPAGSLIISDVFTHSQDSHGVSVAKAAHDLGFEGDVFYQQASPQPLPVLEKGNLALQQLKVSVLDPEVVEEALDRFAVGPALHMLMTGTEEVERASQSGAKHSVLNLSSGVCKAQVTAMLYRQAASDWSGEQSKDTFTSQNMANLFGLNHSALFHSSPLVSGLERQKLQQHLVTIVDRAWNNEARITEQKDNFRKAVETFESGNNSVVVAAGNEGLVKPQLEMESGGLLRVPEDFEANVLGAPAVTSVGATIVIDGVEAPARYSSSWSGVDIYANGDRVLGREFEDGQGLRGAGTSIAAPRISAIMAKLHGDHPEMTSDEVERRVSRDFTQGEIPMLFSSGAQEFLEA